MDILKEAYGGDSGIGREVRKQRRPTRKRKSYFQSEIDLHRPEGSTYILGGKGTGKSTLMLNLIWKDVCKGDMAVIVFDPHAELTHKLLERIPEEHANRVIYFAPKEQIETPFGLNVFEWDGDITTYDEKVEAMLSVFKHLWFGSFSSTPTMQNTLETLTQTLLMAYEKYQTHFLHMNLLLQEDVIGQAWREKLAPSTTGNVGVSAKWSEWRSESKFKSDTGSSKNKINHIVQNKTVQNVLSQETSSDSFRFEELLADRKILLVNLHGLGEENIKLVGSLILTQLKATIFTRETRDPCHIYADEFHFFNPTAFEEIINQARKFGLYCTLAHQTRSQISRKALDAADTCGNKIIFRVGANDARTMAKHFIQDQNFPENGLAHLPRYQAMVLTEQTVDGKILPVQSRIDTYPEKGVVNKTVAEEIKRRSLKYGRPQAEVERRISALYNISPDDDDDFAFSDDDFQEQLRID